jgi:hypothetical protein
MFLASILSYSAPISFGMLFVDYPDPDRPGRLKGEIVSKPELLLKTAIAMALLWLARRLWANLRSPEGKTNWVSRGVQR